MLYRFLTAFVFVVSLYVPAFAGVIELPTNHSTISGIGLISGWKCEAYGEITAKFDEDFGADISMKVLHGSIREDTYNVCGDTHNGFGLLINYNDLGPGEHVLTMYDDDVLFDRVEFTVVTSAPEVSFLRGVTGEGKVSLSNGQDVVVRWSQAKQGFEITKFEQRVTSTCTTKTDALFGIDSYGRARWTITNPCEDKSLYIEIDYSHAPSNTYHRVCRSHLVFIQDNQQYTSVHFRWINTYDNMNVCGKLYGGGILQSIVTINPGVVLDFNAPFEVWLGVTKVATFE